MAIHLSVILYTRLAGLRSLATMSSFDYAPNGPIGSAIATAETLSSPVVRSVLVLGALYVLQALIALARRAGGDRIIGNRPLLLMSGSRVLHASLGQVLRRFACSWLMLRNK